MSHTIDVRLDAGSIEIIAEPRDVPVATVEPYEDSNAGHEFAANTRIELRDDTLFVHAPRGRRLLGRSQRLRLEIRTPLDSRAKVEVASADIDCRGRLGEATIAGASGRVYLEHVAGDATVKNASGSIQVVQVDGALRADSASGEIIAERVGGPARTHSASGDIEIEHAGAGVRADTASGEVRVGTIRRGELRVNTVSGQVSVGVTAGTGVWLDLNTVSGATRSDLDFGAEAPPGGHDLSVRIRTVSGDIDVHRVTQPAPATAEPQPQN